MSDRDRGRDRDMERESFRLPPDQLDRVQALVQDGTYPNRSEVYRTAVRELLDDEDTDSGGDHPWAKV